MSDYSSLRTSTTGQRLRFLLSDTALYGGASAAMRLLSLFTIPVLTRVLSAGEFGAMDALSIWAAVLVLFATLGQDSAVARFFYEDEGTPRRQQMISQALTTTTILSILVALLFAAIAPHVVSATLADPQFVPAARIAAMTIPFTVVAQYFRNLLKWTFSRAGFLFVSLGSTATVVALSILFVTRFDSGVIGVFWAQLIGQSFFAIAGAVLCRRWIVWPRYSAIHVDLLKFGWPYMLIGLLSVAIPAIDRVFISRITGLAALGEYAVGYKLGSLVLFATFAFQTAWGPFSLAIFKEHDAAETYNHALSLYVGVVSIMVFVLAVAAEPVLAVFASRRYAGSAAVVLPIAFGFFAESIGWIMGIGIDLSKKTWGSAMSYCAGLAMAALLMYLLIPRFGILGAAFGTMLGRCAQAIAYTLFACSVYPLRYRWARPIAVASFCFVFAYVIRALTGPAGLPVASTRAIGVIVFVVFVWIVGLTRTERSQVTAAIRAAIGAHRPIEGSSS